VAPLQAHELQAIVAIRAECTDRWLVAFAIVCECADVFVVELADAAFNKSRGFIIRF
jgi:hypothetical protein